MIRKILFNIHWFVGITLGTFLAFSGLTGALMAFGPELTDALSGANRPVAASNTPALTAAALYQKISSAEPNKTITQLMIHEGTAQPVRVTFAAAPGPMGPMGPRAETQLANPYTGELLPVAAAGRRIEWFMSWLRDVHQGHWSGPGTISKVAATCIGLSTVFLFCTALSGLYLRWPRGKAVRNWRSWLKIHPKLKGRAFLWNLHSVFGTCVLLMFLVSAHSGAFQNGEMSWYGNGVRSLFGLPKATEGRGPGGPQPGGPPPEGMGMNAGGPADANAMRLAPPRRSPGVKVIYMNSASYVNADAEPINARIASFNPVSGEIKDQATTATGSRTFGEALAANNQLIHEGRIFGKTGVLIMMSASFCMPVFYITGWMMYLKRRDRKRVTATQAATQTA